MNDRTPTAIVRCSAMVIRDRDILLCKHQDDTWVLPGGTPREGENAGSCVRREILEETGLDVEPDRIAFVLDASDPNSHQHLLEIIFTVYEQHRSQQPRTMETNLIPCFHPLNKLRELSMRPPIAGYLLGHILSWSRLGFPRWETAAYLGNVWRTPDQTAASTLQAPIDTIDRLEPK
ncbi:NUDIX domain-containing protein [Ferrimicrobium sp.]|uniref:NUDIX domain-containing protein n=1 Tax=Ferrimicrobium sp. TaxID=2926050 RepID=UPI002635E88C|nr:NUDIX domain-containing protein [Ferrimicrobium sp.]